jgi:hypothetical protein
MISPFEAMISQISQQVSYELNFYPKPTQEWQFHLVLGGEFCCGLVLVEDFLYQGSEEAACEQGLTEFYSDLMMDAVTKFFQE